MQYPPLFPVGNNREVSAGFWHRMPGRGSASRNAFCLGYRSAAIRVEEALFFVPVPTRMLRWQTCDDFVMTLRVTGPQNTYTIHLCKHGNEFQKILDFATLFRPIVGAVIAGKWKILGVTTSGLREAFVTWRK